MTVAAIAVAALSSAVLSCVPSAAAAQQANEPAIDGDDIGALLGEPDGVAAALPACRAGDESDLALEFPHNRLRIKPGSR